VGSTPTLLIFTNLVNYSIKNFSVTKIITTHYTPINCMMLLPLLKLLSKVQKGCLGTMIHTETPHKKSLYYAVSDAVFPLSCFLFIS
jgi:hypothetical protein